MTFLNYFQGNKSSFWKSYFWFCVSIDSTENRTWQKHDERDFSGKEKKKDMMGLSHDNMADLTGLNNLKNIISHNKES